MVIFDDRYLPVGSFKMNPSSIEGITILRRPIFVRQALVREGPHYENH